MKTLAISLAFGDIYTSEGRGRFREPQDASVLRFKALIELLRKEDIVNPLLVCTAGYTKEDPTTPSRKREVSLAKQLERFGSLEPDWNKWITVFEPRCWSTQNEIRVGLQVAHEHNFTQSDDVQVLLASNWWHLQRIRLYADLHVPKNWKVRYVVVEENFPFREKILECLKLVRDLWQTYRIHKLKKKSIFKE